MRWTSTTGAACLAALGAVMAAGAQVEAPAQTEAPAPASSPEWARGLCDAVDEGVRVLEESRLSPEGSVARAALLEALIRAAEPGAEFFDGGELAAGRREGSRTAWETGLVLVPTEGGPRVAAVGEDSPAARAGLAPGERLETIGGRAAPAGAALAEVREWLAQGNEASVELGVLGMDGESRTVTIERIRRNGASVAATEELPTGIGYIRVAGIHPGAAGEIAAALASWQSGRVFGAILDLRGADGSAEEEVAQAAARFAGEGTLLYTQSDRQGTELAAVKAPAAEVETLPLMVLADDGTCGAAELLAAVLSGSVKGAMLIGRETSGDPLIREPVTLSTGRHAWLATREIRMADGTVYWGAGGVKPDVLITDAALNETAFEPDEPIVLRSKKTVTDEEKEDKALRDRTRHDTYLRRATDLLLGLQALGYDRKR
jgi:carboxyl-terminal processing protease